MVFQLLAGLENSILAHQGAFEGLVSDSQNFSVDGYKSRRDVFSQLFSHEISVMPSSSQGGAPHSNKAKISGATTLVPLGINFEQGDIRNLGLSAPLTAAIQGPGFFLLREGSQTLVTRASNWSFNTNGELIDVAGRQVMGYQFVNGVLDKSTLVPIKIDPTDISQADSGFVDGGIMVSNFQQIQNGAAVESQPLFQLAMGEVPNKAALTPENGTAYSLNRVSGEITFRGVSSEGGLGRVFGTSAESSTVDPAKLSVRGIQLQRSYNALQTSLSTVSKFLETMITTIGKAIG